MNVLVIPEDFRKDQYILKPIAEALLAAIGRPRAKVRVLTEPLLGGVARAIDWSELAKIIDRYQGMVHLFLLIVDRDGDENRRASLDRLEKLAGDASAKVFLAEHAWQEIEIWAIAGQTTRNTGSGMRCAPKRSEGAVFPSARQAAWTPRRSRRRTSCARTAGRKELRPRPRPLPRGPAGTRASCCECIRPIRSRRETA